MEREGAVGAQGTGQLTTPRKVTKALTFDLGFLRGRDFSCSQQ